MREECEHNRPFWECEICGNQKLKTCKFCNHWTQQSFKCDLHPKDIAPFYSDFTCEDWDGETAVIVRKPQMNRSELKVDSADSIPSKPNDNDFQTTILYPCDVIDCNEHGNNSYYGTLFCKEHYLEAKKEREKKNARCKK